MCARWRGQKRVNQTSLVSGPRHPCVRDAAIKPPPPDDIDFTLTVTSTSTEGANGDQASIQQTFDVTVIAVADTPLLAVPTAPLVTNEDTAIDFTGLSS